MRLTRRRTITTQVARLRPSGETPREKLAPFVVEGVLVRVVRERDDNFVEVVPARTCDEGIDYDKPIALLLDDASDDGRPRVFLSSPVRLICSGGEPDDWTPLLVETMTSEYTVLVL